MRRRANLSSTPSTSQGPHPVVPKLLLQALSAHKVAAHYRCALVEVVCNAQNTDDRPKYWDSSAWHPLCSPQRHSSIGV